jgi:SHAQKYF class myb-like DNA-binding protein
MFENGQITVLCSQTGEHPFENPQRDNSFVTSNYKKKKKLINLIGDPFKTGRWTHEEHQKFVEAIFIYGNDWKVVQRHIGTRTSTQARSHAQKFLIRLKKKLQIKSENDKITIGSLDKLSNENVQSCIKEFITNSNGNVHNVNREKLFKVILSFSNLLYFKSKKKERKFAKMPNYSEEIELSKLEKEKNIQILQSEISSLKESSKKVFFIEKMKKFPILGKSTNEIKIFVEEKDVLSFFDNKSKNQKSIKEKRNYIRKTNKFIINNKSEERIEPKTNDATPEIKINDNHNPVSGNLQKAFSLTNNSQNNKQNTNSCNNNIFYSQNKLFKPIETKLNYNVYDDLVCYYDNVNKKLPNQIVHQDENSEYFRLYKFSNASTVANNTDSRSNEGKLFFEKSNEELEDLKILMPSYNNYEDMNINSFIPNNFGYDHNSDVGVKLEDDAFEKFFDFK